MEDELRKSLTQIMRRNIDEQWRGYSLINKPELPELAILRNEEAFFMPPNKLLIGSEQDDLITPISHEIGHYLRYLQNPEKWILRTKFKKIKDAEEVIAELHAITFLDSVGVLNYVLRYEKSNPTSLALYEQDKKSLSKLARLSPEELVEAIR